jgi:hypothetical protein
MRARERQKEKREKKPQMEVRLDGDDHGRDGAFLDVGGRRARTMIEKRREKAMMDERGEIVQLWKTRARRGQFCNSP